MGFQESPFEHERYELLGQLGQGAFGSVVQARDRVTGERIALKELVRAQPDALARFKAEFRSLQDLHHPNLVRLDALVEQRGRWLIAMEYVPGCDLLEWLRPHASSQTANDNAPPFDEVRVRQAFAQLAEALSTLHERGIIHRDLKPSNIRVTPEGRVVLLDFGLATMQDPQAQSTHAAGAGTVAYMAPEQAAGSKVGPAADVYALGVCLYEALTGRLPVMADTILALMMEKQTTIPAAPHTLGPAPDDLSDLCMRWLAPAVADRAGLDVWFDRLTDSGCLPVTSARDSIFAAPAAVFAGREDQLFLLEKEFNRTQNGEVRVVLVEGGSGIGKSSLVAEFVRRLRQQHTDAITLKGRCYENEQLPYKAFDGCIDELARALRKLDDVERRTLLRREVAAAAELFPVLNGVREFPRMADGEGAADPSARRLQAFDALRDLVLQLATDHPLVFLIDDLQWGDAESLRLLRVFTETAKLPVLFLCTVRPRAELDSQIADDVVALRERHCCKVLPLEELTRSQARELATQLMPAGVPDSWLATLVEESGGHPLFLQILTQYAASREIARTGSLTLERALSARVGRLPAAERALLELSALAGRPYPTSVLSSALGAPEGMDDALRSLLAQGLLRTRRGRQVTCFHDAIRHNVVDGLSRARTVDLHRRLARTLEAQDEADPGEIARHWDRAGDPLRAVDGYTAAADRALEQFAFERADGLLGRAIELLDDGDCELQQRLTIQQAHARARGGHSTQAAALYAQAASRATGEERVRLRVAEAQHLLQGAEVQKGLRAARQVLGELDMPLPETQGAIMRRLIWERAWLRMPTLEPEQVRARNVSAEDRLRLDALDALAFPVAITSQFAGGLINARHLKLALKVGAAEDCAVALQTEGAGRAFINPWKVEHAEVLFEQADALTGASPRPRPHAHGELMRGLARQLTDRQPEALVAYQRATDVLSRECPDEPWLLTQIRSQYVATLRNSAQWLSFRRDVERWLAEADEKNDLFARSSLLTVGGGGMIPLFDDEPEAALELLDSALAPWPSDPFNVIHLTATMSRAMVFSYMGGGRTRELMQWLEPRVRTAALTAAGFGRVLVDSVRAGSALEVASADPSSQNLRAAERACRRAQRHRIDFGFSHELQLSVLRGDHDAARAFCKVPSDSSRETAASGDYLLGLLTGGDDGQRLCDGALEHMESQGWKEPFRALCMYSPVIRVMPALEPARRRARPDLLAGRYKLGEPLGEGGYGQVAAARDERTGRELALKELTHSSPSALERFKHEFRALQEIHHPNLVRYESLFQHQGRWFIAMERVDGCDLVRWTRPDGAAMDEERLREAFLQLVDALGVLHDAGFLHRDLNPANIRVQPDGRVVVLDFGLAAALDEDGLAEDGAGVGTAAYMAPEQIDGYEVGPPADVYGVGACLYHCLTGSEPFSDYVPAAVLQAKRTRPVEPAHRLQPEVPADLDQLASDMLAMASEQRPTTAELRFRFDPDRARPPRASTLAPPLAYAFAGRDQELSQLQRAFEKSRSALTMVLLEGQGGIGKSALVQQFVGRLRSAEPDLWVLKGRCYENEQAAYKAFDGAIDQLARELRKAPKPEVESVVPANVAALGQLFPVLQTVPAIARAPRKAIPADPSAQRLAAFGQMTQLLSQVAGLRPLVIVADDLQWADAESFRILRALTQAPTAPPVLLLCTARPQDSWSPVVAQGLSALLELPRVHRIEVQPLTRSESREVLSELLGRDLPPEWRTQVVEDSGGHPMLLQELARYAMQNPHRLGEGEAPSLQAVLTSRVSALHGDARRVLQVVALAGRPWGIDLLERVLDDEVNVDFGLSTLLGEGLLKLGRHQHVSCGHDRLREAVVQALPPAEAQRLYAGMADAFALRPDADPAELARLLDEAGQGERASVAYERAGDRALEQLAFARAEALYARALQLCEQGDAAARHRLTVQRAHALAKAGHSPMAAQLYGQAGRATGGEEGIRLRVAEAQHLLQGGQVEAGLRAARQVLRELGFSFPESQGGILRALLWERMCLRVRRVEPLKRQRRTVSAEHRLKLDTLEALSYPVAMASQFGGALLNARHARLALRAGSGADCATALLTEGAGRIFLKPHKPEAAEPLFSNANALLEMGATPRARAFRDHMVGLSTMLGGQLEASGPFFERAGQLLTQQCTDEPWLLTQVRVNYAANALFLCARWPAFRKEMEGWLEEATERNDVSTRSSLLTMGYGAMVPLFNGDVQGVGELLDEALSPWPERPFSIIHLSAMTARSMTCNYAGSNSLELLARVERDAKGAVMLRAGLGRGALEGTRAVLLMRAAIADRSDTNVRNAVAALDRARKHPNYRSIDARVSSLALQGNRGGALAALEAAKPGLAPAYAPAAEYLHGKLQGGEDGERRWQGALEEMAQGGWSDPFRAIALFAPIAWAFEP